MTREELQQKLRELSERKKEEMRLHEICTCEIVERLQATLRELNKRKHDALEQIADAKREADSVMRKAGRDEQIRYKLACMAIENERQQLFADYKAQQQPDDDRATE